MRKALGRGIGALLPDVELVDNIRLIELEKIQPNPFQPREEVEKNIESLVESIKKHGVLEPILVKRDGEKYQIVAGERRFVAAQKAGLTKVPARIIEVDEPTTAELALVENLMREDLNPIEEATGIETLVNKFGYTHEKIAEILGFDRATVTNKLRLLKLNNEVKNYLKQGLITEGHAKVLLALEEVLQVKLAQLVVNKGLSVRELEKEVQKLKSGISKVEKPHTLRMISVNSGLEVRIKVNRKGGGQLVINFKTKDELLKLSQLLGLKMED